MSGHERENPRGRNPMGPLHLRKMVISNGLMEISATDMKTFFEKNAKINKFDQQVFILPTRSFDGNLRIWRKPNLLGVAVT